MSKQHYEIIIIVDASLPVEEINGTIDTFKTLLSSLEADIHVEENWETRELAYPIKKKKHGYYYIIETSILPEHITAINTSTLQNTKILRHLIVKLDKYGVAYNQTRRQKIAKPERAATSE